MIFLYSFHYCSYIVYGFDVNEFCSIFFYSWETMQVLYEVFPCFHHSFSFFRLPEKFSMKHHSVEYFSECWLIVSRKKAPWITEACSSHHKSIEILISFSLWMDDFFHPIFISHYITVSKNRN